MPFVPVWEISDLYLKVYVTATVCRMHLLVWQTCSLKHHWVVIQEVTHLYCELSHCSTVESESPGSVEMENLFTRVGSDCIYHNLIFLCELYKTFPPSPVINLQMCNIIYISNNDIISDLTVDEIRLWSLEKRPHSGYMKSKTLLFNHL